MEVFISGLLEEGALDQGYAAATGATVTWLAPNDFVKQCEMAENAQSDQRWIWLYRGPWSMLVAPSDTLADQQLLNKWVEQQRVMLKIHYKKPATVFLVNRETTTAQELFSSLGLKPLPTKTTLSPNQHDLSVALAKLFEWIGPYFWEVFEALEAVAWIPEGNSPFFRNQLSPPSLDTVLQISALLTAGHRLPKVEKELTKQLQAVNDLRSDLKKIQVSDSELNELKQENELLLLQLHQIQEDFEKSFLENRERRADLEEENKKQAQKVVQTKQEYQILEQKFAKLVAADKNSAKNLEKMQQANTQLLAEKKALAEQKNEIEQRVVRELKGLQKENELLLRQLHQVQEELEKSFFENREHRADLEEKNKKQAQKVVQTKQEYQILEQKFAKLVAADKNSAKNLEKMQQANTQLLAEKKALAEQKNEIEQRAVRERKELQEENELLLLQLHQVQEELENYFLSGQQMGATFTQSQHTMDQARLLLCRIALQR